MLDKKILELYKTSKLLGIDLNDIPAIKYQKALLGSKRKIFTWKYLTFAIILLVAILYNLRLINNSGECFIEMPSDVSKMFRPMEDCNFCSGITQLPKIINITPDEFEQQFAYSGRPVVIKDGTRNWTALTKFDYWYIKEIYLSELNKGRKLNCQFFSYTSGFTNLYDAFEKITDERAKYINGSEPWYMGWSNCNFEIAEEIRKHYGRPYFLPTSSENNAIDWIFMGGPGLGAHLHVDNVRLSSWQAQISGSKLWNIAPPPECYYDCKFLEIEVKKGEIIVLDTNKWYHKTTVLPGELSITIGAECVDIGKFSMTGSSVRTCIHSEWSGQRPTCYGLNQENDYAMEKAPTILFRHQNGPIAQSNDGKLIVYPGTTLHMECLWMRKFGNPKWIAPHNHTNYTEGWVTEVGRDSLLEFRLSITNAKADDSGRFTCQTPARHEHSVDVLIKAVNCPEIPHRRGLKPSTNSTILFTKVLFNCINGNSLIGASEIICSPSGNWSAPLPVCESVECGDIPIGASSNRSAPRVAVLSREVGGRAAFSCKSGFGLRGPSESTCLPTGEWKTPFPTCLEVQCENPGAPANGYVQGSAPYRASDVVQFNCNPEYMMQGQPIIACQDNGRWSGGLPKCVQACSYPGTAIAGRMSLVKFYYAIGESVTFTCDAGLELRGARMLKCLRNGKWSNAIPTCVTGNATNYRDSESK